MYYLQSRYYDPETGRFINSDVLTSTGQGLLGNNMFAYCGNNPIGRIDSAGCFWDTVFDVVSLVASVVDVVNNPTDVGAWVGLAMDVVDVAIPCVGGLGEIVDAVNVARKTSSKVGDAIDAARAVDNATDMADNMYDAGKAFDGALCFVAGTVVLTGKGHAAIETIQPGDQVWAWDERTGDIALKRLSKHTSTRQMKSFIFLLMANRSLQHLHILSIHLSRVGQAQFIFVQEIFLSLSMASM